MSDNLVEITSLQLSQMDEILTAEQVAKVLQVHPFTVLKFIKKGKLKASKLGRVYRIRRSEVEKLLDTHMEQPKEKSEEPERKSAHGGGNKIPRKERQKNNDTKAHEQHNEQTGKNRTDHYVLKIKEQ